MARDIPDFAQLYSLPVISQTPSNTTQNVFRASNIDQAPTAKALGLNCAHLVVSSNGVAAYFGSIEPCGFLPQSSQYL